MNYADCVIVGSGFGGAVAASRLGRYLALPSSPLKSVHVFDKGDDPTGCFDPNSRGATLNGQGNRFRHTLDPRYLSRIAEVFTDPEGVRERGAPTFNVLAGIGLGGGSNVYSGVSLRAPAMSFERARGGRRLWPSALTRRTLDPYYDRVDAKLRVHRLRWTDQSVPHWQLATKRDFVFAEGCRRVGATAIPAKVAVHEDRNEGWWSQGQVFEGRQSLTQNYLKEALADGVTFSSGCEIEDVARGSDGFRLKVIDRRGLTPERYEFGCRLLFVACGAVASSGLLLRSHQSTGLGSVAQQHLGAHLSGNGDYGVTGRVGADFERDVQPERGKPIASLCPSFFRESGFLLLPFYAEPMYLALGRISALVAAQNAEAVGRRSTVRRPGALDFGAQYLDNLQSFNRKNLSMGCLAFDDSEGHVALNARGRPTVLWQQTSAQTEARWSKAIEVMRKIYEALGGEMYLDNYRELGTVNTSHPLGGASMGDSPETGAVDQSGELYGEPNLFVVDGAVIPAALAVNPSMTIAAVAERMMDRLLSGAGTRSLQTRLESDP